MKSSKLMEYYKKGNLVIPLYLLENYKKFQIDMDQFVFLMYLYHLGNSFPFDPEKFSSEFGVSTTDILNYIGILTEKKLVRVEVVKNDKGIMEEVVLLDDFYHKISLIMMDDANQETITNTNIFEIIEKEFSRTLSPIEYEIIKAWLESNISEELIKEAVKEATFNGVSNLRYIDKILYEWNKNGIKDVSDVEKAKKKRNAIKEKQEEDIDLEAVDWDWFDD